MNLIKEQRAEFAEGAVIDYSDRVKDQDGYEDDSTEMRIVDLIADLHLYCDAQQLDWDDILYMSQEWYEEQK